VWASRDPVVGATRVKHSVNRAEPPVERLASGCGAAGEPPSGGGPCSVVPYGRRVPRQPDPAPHETSAPTSEPSTAPRTEDALDQVRSELARWTAPDERQERLRADYLAHVHAHGTAALTKGGHPAHLTASCVVLSEDLAETLLCFHRKGRFWVQLGGHLEASDGSLLDAAGREAREESGATTVQILGEAPFDLDRHALSGGWTCAEHLDVGFVAVVPRSAAVAASDESEALAWWPVSALPADSVSGLADRVSRARRHAARVTG